MNFLQNKLMDLMRNNYYPRQTITLGEFRQTAGGMRLTAKESKLAVKDLQQLGFAEYKPTKGTVILKWPN